ncbi:MAG: NrtA/SsuA/CpmA family ABC transporter substrate-binding protein, partial [Gallionella sp.]
LKEEGLNVSYQRHTSGKNALQAVLDGQADIATVYQTPVVIAALNGAPVRILSTLHRSNKNSAVVARRDLGVEKMKDLKGKRIGVTFGTYQATLLNRLLEDDDVKSDQVTLIDMPHADTPAALATGKVAAVMTRWPFVGKAQTLSPAGSTLLLDTSMYSEISVLATTQQIVTQRSESLYRLMRAMVKAERYIDTHPDLALALAMRHWQRTATDDDRQIWNNIQLQLRLDNALVQSMDMEAEWLYRHGKAPQATASLENLLASDFLKAARPQSVLVREDRQ